MTTARKLQVAIFFGGRSGEHEISILSARFIVEALDKTQYEPILIGIERSGTWRLQDQSRFLALPRDPRHVSIDPSGAEVWLLPRPETDGTFTLMSRDGKTRQIDVAFPILHGPLGEDGTIQGLFELAGLPHVGAGVLGSAASMDKDVMKRLLLQAGLPCLPYIVLREATWRAQLDAQKLELGRLGFPLFVKPARLGSSVGVAKVKAAAELEAAVTQAFAYDEKVIVEQGLERPREIECAVLAGEPPQVSLPGEIVVTHADGFYSYSAKYLDETGATTDIADLSETKRAEAQHLARRVFEVMECAGLARVDLFLSQSGTWHVNELNTLPGFTAISMYPKLWEKSGIAGAELISRLIADAIERNTRRTQKKLVP